VPGSRGTPKLRRLTGLTGRRHGEKLGWVWTIVFAVLYAPVSLLVKVRYRHIERIPGDGPAILVVNHVSHVDPLLVAKLVLDAGRVPRVLAKESIFAVPVVGAAMRGMGHIPVRRGSVDARESLSAATAALAAGRLIVLHPEGTVTRDPDGWPMAARTGAARMALLSPDVPVIPVAQWGVQQQIDLYRKRVRLIPRPKHVLAVGDPVDLSPFAGREPDMATLRDATDVIMRRLRADLAELRGLPAPQGPLYRWSRNSSSGTANTASTANTTSTDADSPHGTVA
jgi:1-acyl-sn-glycerol-3-phosphate acyltransferase